MVQEMNLKDLRRLQARSTFWIDGWKGLWDACLGMLIDSDLCMDNATDLWLTLAKYACY
jgi:hypothetical protein